MDRKRVINAFQLYCENGLDNMQVVQSNPVNMDTEGGHRKCLY